MYDFARKGLSDAMTSTHAAQREERSSVLVCSDIAVRFGGIDALAGVSLKIDHGEVIALIGPNGAVVASDDDGGGGTNSRIPAGSGNYTVPSSGTYTIEATSYHENKVGSYTLILIGTALKFTLGGRVAVGTWDSPAGRMFA